MDLNTIADAIEKNGIEQIVGSFIRYDNQTSKPNGACALGMAAYNLGDQDMHRFNESLNEIDLYLMNNHPAGIECPSDEKTDWCYARSLRSMIIHVNDNHNWTLKKIADYVRTQA